MVFHFSHLPWVLVKGSTWRKHCVSFLGFHTFHTNGSKNVLVLHIGLICKLKGIAIFKFLGLEFIISKKHWCHSWLIFYKLKIWEFDGIKFHVRLITLNVNIHVHIAWCKCSNYFETFESGFHYLKGINPYLLLRVLIH